MTATHTKRDPAPNRRHVQAILIPLRRLEESSFRPFVSIYYCLLSSSRRVPFNQDLAKLHQSLGADASTHWLTTLRFPLSSCPCWLIGFRKIFPTVCAFSRSLTESWNLPVSISARPAARVCSFLARVSGEAWPNLRSMVELRVPRRVSPTPCIEIC
jgi:hypothetical protein